MKGFLSGAALICALATGSAARAADYAVINLETAVEATPDAAWARIGGYCAIGDWLKRAQPCVMAAGTGGVGSIRKLGPTGGIVEVMVAQTPHSYTYTQPTTTILYHGTLAAQPLDGGKRTKLVYTLFYDQEPDGTQEAKDKDRAARTANFTTALANMKALIEGK